MELWHHLVGNVLIWRSTLRREERGGGKGGGDSSDSISSFDIELYSYFSLKLAASWNLFLLGKKIYSLIELHSYFSSKIGANLLDASWNLFLGEKIYSLKRMKNFQYWIGNYLLYTCIDHADDAAILYWLKFFGCASGTFVITVFRK